MRLRKLFVPMATALLVAVTATVGYHLTTGDHTKAAQNSKCADGNSFIMQVPDGAKDAISSPSDFVNKIRSNWKDCGDYEQIYKHYGLPASDYNRFASEAKKGYLKDGKIYVDNVLVLDNVRNVGRRMAAQGKKVVINNTAYYEHDAKQLGGPRPVTVLFNKEGKVQFSLLDVCANPQPGTPVHPTYGCKTLNVAKVNDTTFNFSTDVSIVNPANSTNRAQVTRVVYTFPDGTVTKTDPQEKVTKTFTTPGAHKVRVTAYVKTTFGSGEIALTAANCEQTITIKEPAKPAEPTPPKTPTPEPPAPEAPAPETPAELPATGATITGILGLSALVTVTVAYLSSRRSIAG